jgi:hypothetical protein
MSLESSSPVSSVVGWSLVALDADSFRPKASPADVFPQEEVSMQSSCFIQGPLIAENAV